MENRYIFFIKNGTDICDLNKVGANGFQTHSLYIAQNKY